MECAATPAPVTRVLHAAILHHAAPRAELKEIVQEAGQLEVPRLERRLAVLATIALVTPLIGLLGTVAGLIEAFVNISSQSGFSGATDIAGGIYQSLLTTAAGLVVAIPCSVAYAYLSSRVNALMHDMERAGIEVVNLIAAHRTTAGHHRVRRRRPRRRARRPSKPRPRLSPAPRVKLTRTLHVHPALFPVLPLVNVLFLVLMLFAMSSRFVLQPGIAVNLPFSSFTLEPQQNPQLVSVTAAPRPAIYHLNHQVSLDELDAQLANGPAEKRSLIIKADRDAPVRPRGAGDEPRAQARLLRRARHARRSADALRGRPLTFPPYRERRFPLTLIGFIGALGLRARGDVFPFPGRSIRNA